MSDNKSAHKAADYETEVRRTIPFHGELLKLAVDAALGVHPSPARWLDTGAGPGVLVEQARATCAGTEFWIADPSEAMRALAVARLALPAERVLACGSADLPDVGPFDVITAVQCHHYGDMAARAQAVTRCRELLAPGGALVVFENVRAESERGLVLQRARWATWQRSQGRDEETVQAHLAREGTQFFPIRVSQHLGLFAHLGFETVELIWRAYGQAGFLAIK
jgi:tRNA (cmo5U34)-methyltransferase